MEVKELENNIGIFISELKEDEISESSLKIYESNIRQFIKYLKEKNKESFTKTDYSEYKFYLKENNNYKISTINKYVVILNKYMSYLGHDELKIKQLRIQKKHYVDNVPTVIDYKRILRAAHKHDEIAYYFILIASYTGMRVSAICSITIESLKESKKNDDYISIYSKGKYNEVPFPAWLRREILNYAKKHKITSGYLFPSPKDKTKPMCRKTMWEKVHKVTGYARVNLDKGHPHAFRHLLGKEITSQLNNDTKTVADLLGHENTRTTEQYQQKTKKEISTILNNFRYK